MDFNAVVEHNEERQLGIQGFADVARTTMDRDLFEVACDETA
jgi:hypothetical protein